MPDEHFITNSANNDDHLAICTRVALVIPIQNSFMTKTDFVKASKGEFSETQQINYSTVLPGFDLVQMADDCEEYILMKNRLSDILSNEPPLKCLYSGGGGSYISSCSFIY